ncbi:MAG: hypothetical protein FJX52_01300 [Alphaproteobacteria bacterium]|nr:hypothetical protein [Alphaproteobacteria bacterium]
MTKSKSAGANKPDKFLWCGETLDARVDRELAGLSPNLRARFVWIADMLAAHGPHRVREPCAKPLSGKLWEMRMKGLDNIARAVIRLIAG